MEKRSFVSRAEIRADEARYQLMGTAVAYNTRSAVGVPSGDWQEIVAPGTFKESLAAANADVRALWQHDTSKPLGRQKNATLRLSDTPTGLNYVLQLDRTSTFHQDCWAAIRRGDVDAMSFGFIVEDQKVDSAAKLRTLVKADLLEISFVTWPAYDKGTSAEARAAAASGKTQVAKEVIKILRKAMQSIVGAKVRAESSPIDFASHLQRCHEYAELCSSFAEQADDCMDGEEGGCDDEDTRAAFRLAKAHAELCCDRFAAVTHLHRKWADRKKK